MPLHNVHPDKDKSAAFTVLELLVSMAIFTVFGLALAVFMSSSVESYRINSARKQAYSTASAVLGQLQLDLTHAWIAPGDRNPNVDVKFIATRDSRGCTQLVFTAQSQNPEEDPNDVGLREIAWYVDPNSTFPYNLCRVERLGVGGEESLFENMMGADPATSTFGGGIGYFSIRFIPDVSSLAEEAVTIDSNVLEYGYATWDSTRGKDPRFELFVENSADNPWDDLLPGRVVITLSVVPDSGLRAVLIDDLDANGTIVHVNDTQGFPGGNNPVESFIHIGDEWLFYATVDAENFGVFERGSRSTVPAAHKAGDEVRAGYSFIRTLVIPCGGKAIR
ncbi:MAG: hypothetical protein Kow00107_06270 [Planctomycetota bacterium]